MTRAPLALLGLLLLLTGPASAQETAAKLPTISAKELAARRAKVAKAFEGTLVLMEADPLGQGMGSIDSNTPVYDFFYLTGYHREKDILALGGGPKGEILFSEGKPDELAAQSGVVEVRPLDKFEEFVRDMAARKVTMTTRLREEAKETVSNYAEKSGAKVESAGQKIWQTITKLRMIKSPAELDMIRKASDATNKAHLEAMRACRPGKNEKDLQTIIEAKFKSEGCDGLSFPSIVGSGKNGTILHYDRNTMEIPKDTLIVCDIGAAYRGYVTDITRTIPTEGKFNPEHKAAYQAVLDAQKAAERILRPGVTFDQLGKAAAKVLKDRGLTDWSFAHSKDRSVTHLLCHYVGLAVHDSGPNNVKLEAGMVITIEPGYYNKEKAFGIRIEDIYIVTPEGCERMSAGAPREIAEIEKLMAEANKDF